MLGMGRKRRKRWGMPEDRREPLGARVSVLMILTNIFLWVGLRNVDVLVVSLISVLVAVVGLVMGYKAGRRIRRRGGRLAGETMASIGYWGNLGLFVVTFFLFSYSLAMAILRGDIL